MKKTKQERQDDRAIATLSLVSSMVGVCITFALTEDELDRCVLEAVAYAQQNLRNSRMVTDNV